MCCVSGRVRCTNGQGQAPHMGANGTNMAFLIVFTLTGRRGKFPARGAVCWCPPRCGAPCAPPAVLCAPLWWTRAPCAAPPCGGFLPRVLVPPRGPRCCGPDRVHCYDRREATARPVGDPVEPKSAIFNLLGSSRER